MSAPMPPSMPQKQRPLSYIKAQSDEMRAIHNLLFSYGQDASQSNNTLVETMGRISALKIVSSRLDDQVLERLTWAMEQCPSVEELEIGGGSISDSALFKLGDMLAKRQLKTLIVEDIALDDNRFVYLLTAIKAMRKTLQKFSVARNSITDKGMVPIAQVLGGNKVLKHLDLSCNIITDKGASAFANALRDDCYLDTLSMAKNRIGTNGATHLALAVRYNGILRELDVSGNMIGTNGVDAFCEAIRENVGLVKFSMTGNQYGDKEAMNLIAAMKASKCGKVLDIYREHETTRFSEEVVAALKDAIATSNSKPVPTGLAEGGDDGDSD